MRVLVMGFLHETNTFAASKADWEAFKQGSFPSFVEGQALLDAMKGVNLAAGGFIHAADQRGWTVVPSLWCRATPSAHVTRDAFERISAVLTSAAASNTFDAIYVDFHGAGVAEHVDDLEGEILSRLRGVVGGSVPVVISLDLHANITQRMLELADAMVSYREYPHVDMADTGVLAAQLLARRVAAGRRETLAYRRLPFLIPTNSQSTRMLPAREHYALLRRLDQANGTLSSFCMGFPAADFPECAPMVWTYGERAQETLDTLYEAVSEPSQWRLKSVYLPDESVMHAISLAETSDRPILIVDTQDNPSGGADGNTSGMLHALLRNGAGRRFPQRVVIGLIHDPEAVAKASQAGLGAVVPLSVGTSVSTFQGTMSEPPVQGEFKVVSLSDGAVTLRGPMMTGMVARLGPSACLEIDGIYVIVITGKMQLLDRVQISLMGLAPQDMKIICIKSANHFRADFSSLVRDPETDFLIAKCPGPKAVDPGDYAWTRLSPDVRLRP